MTNSRHPEASSEKLRRAKDLTLDEKDIIDHLRFFVPRWLSGRGLRMTGVF